MIRRTQKHILFLVTAAAIVLACMPTLAPAPTPIPTFDPNSLGTFIAETANAAASQTQVFITPSATSTFTPTPTKTPSDTPTPTQTFIYVISTKTTTPTVATGPAGGSADYACTILAQSPENNSILTTGSVFAVRWQVKNTGLVIWDSNNIDYRYKSGTKMHMKPAYDLYKNVPAGEVADIIVDMKAPATPDTYTTTWKLRMGKTEFCTMTLTIIVQ
jgi:hypothetical protein